MDNERALKVELSRALDEVLPPAPWLEAAVKDDLRKRRSRGRAGSGSGPSLWRRPAWPLSAVQLAAVVLIVLVAGAAAAFFESRYLTPRSEPAALDLVSYQGIVSRDFNRLSTSGGGFDCTTVESNCPGPGRQVLGAIQLFLDDLNRSRPPASLAVTNDLMRRHLAAGIADLNAMFAAYAAKDQVALDRDNYLFNAQGEWLSAMRTSISESRQGTVASYVSSVRDGIQSLWLCPGCRPLQLAGQDCAEIQSVPCEADVVYAKLDIETLESAVAAVTAPTSLADQDTLLQHDLSQADTVVLALASAQLTGDQVGFSADRALLAQKLLTVNADVAGIEAAHPPSIP